MGSMIGAPAPRNSKLAGGTGYSGVMSMMHYLNAVQSTFLDWANEYRGKTQKYQPESIPTISNLDNLMDRLLEENCSGNVADERIIAQYGNLTGAVIALIMVLAIMISWKLMAPLNLKGTAIGVRIVTACFNFGRSRQCNIGWGV
jgi:phage-related protein